MNVVTETEPLVHASEFEVYRYDAHDQRWSSDFEFDEIIAKIDHGFIKKILA